MKKIIFLSASIVTLFTTAAFGVKPPGHGSGGHGATSAPSEAATPASDTLSGKVLESMNSGGYTYVNIQKKNGEKAWVAVSEAPVKVGEQISFKPGSEMLKFESKSLKRTFDSIIFSEGVLGATAATAATTDHGKEQGASQGSKSAALAKEVKIAVTKAKGTNAVTIEGAFANSAKLDKKKVIVRGKVVKISVGIMGKNWIHIQDGTGSQAKGDHNLVCTSKDRPKVGAVVTIKGKLAKDRDFGSGYLYAVIVEDAKVN